MFKLIGPPQKITQNLNQGKWGWWEGNRKNNGRVFTNTEIMNRKNTFLESKEFQVLMINYDRYIILVNSEHTLHSVSVS